MAASAGAAESAWRAIAVTGGVLEPAVEGVERWREGSVVVEVVAGHDALLPS
jgi:hypothetical protein